MRYLLQVRYPHRAYRTFVSSNHFDAHGWQHATSLPNRTYRVLDTHTGEVVCRKRNP